MKRKTIIISLVLSLALVLTLASACTPDENGTQTPAGTATPTPVEDDTSLKSATVSLWAHWGSEQRRPTVNKMIEMFNDEYSDVGLVAEYVYVPWGDLPTKLLASVAAGNPPSVAITGIEDVGVKAMRKQAADITDYIQDGQLDKYYPATVDAVTYNNRIFALPFNTDTRMLYVNADYAADAGLPTAEDFREEIKTWDDLYALADDLDVQSGNAFSRVTFLPIIGNFGFTTMIVNNGGSVFDNDLRPDTVELDSAQNIETLEYMQQWSDRYGQTEVQSLLSSAVGANDHFLSGKVAIFGHTCNYIATLETYASEDFNYYAVPMPAGPSSDGTPKAWGGGFVANVPYGAANLREATRLAEFFTSGESAAVWALEQADVMCDIEANEQEEMLEKNGWDVVLEMLPNTEFSSRHPFAPNAAAEVDNAVNSIVRDFTATDAEAALKTARESIEKMIADDKAIWG